MSDNGHYRKYLDKRFNDTSLKLIHAANQIIDSYSERGYSLTLRQLYYQFVSRDLLPNTQESYNKLGDVVSNGRLAGLISWTAIEDRTRNLKGAQTWETPAEIIRSAAAGYQTDRWKHQNFRPEIWIEKDALAGVIAPVCHRMGVNYFACRGYNSQSEQWLAGQRFAGYIKKGQRPIVFHLGDHDPSGLDMTRDNQERLSMFAGVSIQVVRLALNWPQIQKYDPPPNPAKMTDSRATKYVEEHGDSSWELDALQPEVIEDLIRDALMAIRDEAAWNEALLEETNHKEQLADIVKSFEGKT